MLVTMYIERNSEREKEREKRTQTDGFDKNLTLSSSNAHHSLYTKWIFCSFAMLCSLSFFYFIQHIQNHVDSFSPKEKDRHLNHMNRQKQFAEYKCWADSHIYTHTLAHIFRVQLEERWEYYSLWMWMWLCVRFCMDVIVCDSIFIEYDWASHSIHSTFQHVVHCMFWFSHLRSYWGNSRHYCSTFMRDFCLSNVVRFIWRSHGICCWFSRTVQSFILTTSVLSLSILLSVSLYVWVCIFLFAEWPWLLFWRARTLLPGSHFVFHIYISNSVVLYIRS